MISPNLNTHRTYRGPLCVLILVFVYALVKNQLVSCLILPAFLTLQLWFEELPIDVLTNVKEIEQRLGFLRSLNVPRYNCCLRYCTEQYLYGYYLYISSCVEECLSDGEQFYFCLF